MSSLKIIEFDERRNLLTLRIDAVDDLYVLFHFIRPGDLVTAKTTRKIRVGEKEAIRKAMELTIEVTKVGFHEFSERLRISGIIREGPEDLVSLGSHHTINIKVGSILTIIRPLGFSKVDLEPLKEAEKLSATKPLILIAIEEGEATIGILTSYGLQIYTSIYKNISKGSSEYESLLKAFFSEVLNVIKDLIARFDPAALIIAGPGFTKENFIEYLKRNIKKDIPIIMDSVTSGTEAGVHEIIRRGLPEKVIQKQKVSYESRNIEELLYHISKKDNLAVYGLNDVEKAVEWGLAKKLLISMSLLNTLDSNLRNKILSIIENAKKTKTEVIFISTIHPLGKQFAKFGGIAAILRYPYTGEFK